MSDTPNRDLDSVDLDWLEDITKPSVVVEQLKKKKKEEQKAKQSQNKNTDKLLQQVDD